MPLTKKPQSDTPSIDRQIREAQQRIARENQRQLERDIQASIQRPQAVDYDEFVDRNNQLSYEHISIPPSMSSAQANLTQLQIDSFDRFMPKDEEGDTPEKPKKKTSILDTSSSVDDIIPSYLKDLVRDLRPKPKKNIRNTHDLEKDNQQTLKQTQGQQPKPALRSEVDAYLESIAGQIPTTVQEEEAPKEEQTDEFQQISIKDLKPNKAEDVFRALYKKPKTDLELQIVPFTGLPYNDANLRDFVMGNTSTEDFIRTLPWFNSSGMAGTQNPAPAGTPALPAPPAGVSAGEGSGLGTLATVAGSGIMARLVKEGVGTLIDYFTSKAKSDADKDALQEMKEAVLRGSDAKDKQAKFADEAINRQIFYNTKAFMDYKSVMEERLSRDVSTMRAEFAMRGVSLRDDSPYRVEERIRSDAEMQIRMAQNQMHFTNYELLMKKTEVDFYRKATDIERQNAIGTYNKQVNNIEKQANLNILGNVINTGYHVATGEKMRKPQGAIA